MEYLQNLKKPKKIHLTTHELISACLRGSPEAEKQLFFKYAGKVLTICRRYVRDEAEAKDLLQECFIMVFNKIEQYDSQRGEFSAWLHRVSTNVVLQHLRKMKRKVPTVYPEILPETEEEIEEEAFDLISDDMLLSSIRELPEGYRQILNLHVFEGLKHKEIASRLNISEGTSRSQYARAKRLLKSILQKKTEKINLQYERRLA